MTQGYTATLVAGTLNHQPVESVLPEEAARQPSESHLDEQIVVACGEKPGYGYRRVTWWLRRKENLPVNRKRVLRVMRERGLRARRKKEWGRVEAAGPNQIWQSDMTKIWAGSAVGWAYLVSVIDCCTREIVSWNLSDRCRTEEALDAVEQAVLERLPEGSPAGEHDPDHRQWHTVHFFPVRGDPEPAEHHASSDRVSSPGRQQLHRAFHRSLKEEEVWTAEYRSLEEARASIAR